MRLAMLLLFSCFALGCAGIQEYPTGIPLSGSQKFFFHVGEEAKSRGFKVHEYTDGAREVVVDAGRLRYDTNDDGVVLTVFVKGSKDMSDDELASAKEGLKGLSDDIVAKARERAESANAFD